MSRLPVRTSSPSRSETLRRRIRARAAEAIVTHDRIAQQLRDLGFSVSRQRVSDVIAGRVKPQLDELWLWAKVLDTSEAYLLGFTWDPRPEEATPAAIVGGDNPGLHDQQFRHPSRRHLHAVPS